MGTTIFHGCKVALYLGPRLVILQRDDRPDIPFPGLWDFPGGGREGDESPEETLFREVREEIDLHLTSADLLWRCELDAAHTKGARVHFFVAQRPATDAARIVLGDEGQGWRLVSEAAFLALPDAVPSLPGRLRLWQAERARQGR